MKEFREYVGNTVAAITILLIMLPFVAFITAITITLVRAAL